MINLNSFNQPWEEDSSDTPYTVTEMTPLRYLSKSEIATRLFEAILSREDISVDNLFSSPYNQDAVFSLVERIYALDDYEVNEAEGSENN